jgi:hydrogenase-4 component B
VIATALLAGLSLIGIGGVLSGARRGFAAGLTLTTLGAATLGVVGFTVLATGDPVGSPFTSELTPSFGLDRLSGVFLGTLGLVAAPAVAFSASYLRPRGAGRATAGLTALFLCVLTLVLTARDPLTFLTGWELMTLVPAGVILVARGCDARARGTVFTYLAITHLSGVGTWAAVLLLASKGAFGPGDGLRTGSALQILVALAALVGMGTKAGVMPLHVWLPRAHPIAPAPVSALMSGVMIKVAIYALVRVLVEWVGVLPTWFGIVVTAIGALSAVGGVLYAIFQHELKRLLALHSIENIGIIVLGLGACLLLRARGEEAFAAFALAAALLHTVNHAVFKALLFLGAGAFERAVGTLELDKLGGLLRRMPRTGTAFLIGAAAIAGLPPLNGFVSEWSTMQALLRVTTGGDVGDGLTGAIALAALAATAALALLCFVKVVGLVLLGPARYQRSEPVKEMPLPMTAAMGTLALGCVLLGLAPGTLFGPLTEVLPGATGGASGIGLRLPVAGGTDPISGFPSVGLLAVLVVLTAGLGWLRGRHSAEAAPTWVCGQELDARLNWTSAGFTKPLRMATSALLRPRAEITVREESGVVREVTYWGQVPQLVDDWIYRPVARWSIVFASHARRLQTGSLGIYVAYLIGLVVALLGAARIGLF